MKRNWPHYTAPATAASRTARTAGCRRRPAPLASKARCVRRAGRKSSCWIRTAYDPFCSPANSTATGDNNTAYDPLSRLDAFERGTLSASGNNGSTLDTVASPSASQSWNLNAVGDQSSVTTNGTTTTNSTNAKNELTTNGVNSLTFDNNGNTLTDENGQSYTYSAWNQQVTVKSSGGTIIAYYGYDAQGRRITEGNGTTTTAVYFSNQWQAIEERVGGTATRQDVWGIGFVNQLIERDDNSVSGTLGISGSGLGERLYAQQDANWNVTSLVDASGNVAQRMVYSPYGGVTFLTASWSPTTDAYAQNVLFQGGRLETATGSYVFEHRDYNSLTGTWAETDPLVYADGMDFYALDHSAPTSKVDPRGLSTVHCYTWMVTVSASAYVGLWGHSHVKVDAAGRDEDGHAYTETGEGSGWNAFVSGLGYYTMSGTGVGIVSSSMWPISDGSRLSISWGQGSISIPIHPISSIGINGLTADYVAGDLKWHSGMTMGTPGGLYLQSPFIAGGSIEVRAANVKEW
jgi:RHS repeat-associated protein